MVTCVHSQQLRYSLLGRNSLVHNVFIFQTSSFFVDTNERSISWNLGGSLELSRSSDLSYIPSRSFSSILWVSSCFTRVDSFSEISSYESSIVSSATLFSLSSTLINVDNYSRISSFESSDISTFSSLIRFRAFFFLDLRLLKFVLRVHIHTMDTVFLVAMTLLVVRSVLPLCRVIYVI